MKRSGWTSLFSGWGGEGGGGSREKRGNKRDQILLQRLVHSRKVREDPIEGKELPAKEHPEEGKREGSLIRREGAAEWLE